MAKPTFTHSTRSRRLRSKMPGPVEKERAWRTVSTTGHTSTHTWRASPTCAVTVHCRPSKVAPASMPTPSTATTRPSHDRSRAVARAWPATATSPAPAARTDVPERAGTVAMMGVPSGS